MVVYVVGGSAREKDSVSGSYMKRAIAICRHPETATQNNVKDRHPGKIYMQTPGGTEFRTAENNRFHCDRPQNLGDKILGRRVRDPANRGEFHGQLDTSLVVMDMERKRTRP